MMGQCNTFMHPFVVLFLLICVIVSAVNGFAYELTLVVEPGQRECFYQQLTKTGDMLEVDYQVLEGAGMDITFIVRDPNGITLKSDMQRKMGSHQIQIGAVGDYELCFDNSFSRMTAKMLFFELYSETDDESLPSAIHQAQQGVDKETATIIMDMAVDEIQKSLTRLQRNTEKTKMLQNLVTSFMKRDRNIVENMYTRVNLFSGGYLIAMISVSLVQVLMIRSLFTTSAAGHHMKMST